MNIQSTMHHFKDKFLFERSNFTIDEYQKISSLLSDPQVDRTSKEFHIEVLMNKIRQCISQTLQEKEKQSINTLTKLSQILVQKIISEIQLIDYSKKSSEENFCKVIKDFIHFQSEFPVSQADIGKMIISNGIFHQMWEKIVTKKKIASCFYSLYYNRYRQLIQANYSNFENAFNPLPSSRSSQKFQEYQYSDGDTTNLQTAINRVTDIFESSKENLQPLLTQDQAFQFVQKNQRILINGVLLLTEKRIAAQLACSFFNLPNIYNLDSLEITEVLELQRSVDAEYIVVRANVEEFIEVIGRKVMNFRSKILVGVCKFNDLRLLLRLEESFGTFQGFVVYDQLLNVEKYLEHRGI